VEKEYPTSQLWSARRSQLWHVFAFLFGSAAALDALVRQTFVAELVGEDDLPNAVALNSMPFNLARLIGSAVSRVAIATVGTTWAFSPMAHPSWFL
jgi:predicted MFS family arabinose efflux permease